MPVYTIPIHGLIGPNDPEKPDNQKHFEFSDMLIHVNKAQAFDTLELDIASDGGYVDVADKMIEVLQATKKQITSKNSGNVASAASKIFMLAPKGFRSFDPAKGVFLIHMPFGSVENGTSDEFAEAAKYLEGLNNEYAKWYSNATGSDATVIRAFMTENVPLTPDQIESLGFATIVKPVINAVAKLKSNNSQMDNKEVIEKLNAFEKILLKVSAMFKAKALMIADVNGSELEFPDLADPAEVKEGVKVNAAGQPATGEFQLPDGTVLVCDAGMVKEVKPADAPDEMQALKDEIEALKAENESLKATKAEAENVKAEAEKGLNEVKAEFKKFKAQFSNGNPTSGTPPAGDTQNNSSRKPFKSKE